MVHQAQFSCNFDPFVSYLAVNYMDRFVSKQDITVIDYITQFVYHGKGRLVVLHNIIVQPNRAFVRSPINLDHIAAWKALAFQTPCSRFHLSCCKDEQLSLLALPFSGWYSTSLSTIIIIWIWFKWIVYLHVKRTNLWTEGRRRFQFWLANSSQNGDSHTWYTQLADEVHNTFFIFEFLRLFLRTKGPNINTNS